MSIYNNSASNEEIAEAAKQAVMNIVGDTGAYYEVLNYTYILTQRRHLDMICTTVAAVSKNNSHIQSKKYKSHSDQFLK